jgi:predicted glycoside hydrolase/deacetylase ChbG (UPF0249 family)
MKQLIVNADDFGLTSGVNAGIVQAFEQGIVRSTSLMVRQPAAEAAAQYARAHPALGVGLHLDLWESVHEGDDWRRLYQHCADDPVAIAAELRAQLARFIALVGRPPDHLNSHQHVHRREPVASVVRALAAESGLPLRDDVRVGYVGSFYGQDDRGRPWPQCITVDHLLTLIDALPEGWTEFGCHPGIVGADESLGGTMYRVERNDEVRALCDPRVRERLARGDVQLARWSDVQRTHTTA